MMAAKKTAAKKTAPVQTEKIATVEKTVKVEEKSAVAEKAEKAAEEKKPAAVKAEEKKPAAKRTTKKAVKTTFVVQAANKEVTMEEAVERVKAAWISTGNKEADLKEIAVYVKPEENSIYYVVNGDITGRVDF